MDEVWTGAPGARLRPRSRVRVGLVALALSLAAHAAAVLALGARSAVPAVARPLFVRLLPLEEAPAVAPDAGASAPPTVAPEPHVRRARPAARVARPSRAASAPFPVVSAPVPETGVPPGDAGTERLAASGGGEPNAAAASPPTLARVLHSVRPDYPPRARREGVAGTVRLRARVLASGRVADVVLDESAGDAELDRAAALALARWSFEPLSEASGNEEVWVVVPIVFRLR